MAHARELRSPSAQVRSTSVLGNKIVTEAFNLQPQETANKGDQPS